MLHGIVKYKHILKGYKRPGRDWIDIWLRDMAM